MRPAEGTIVAVRPAKHAGPGWSNQVVWVYIRTPGGAIVERALQREQWMGIPGLSSLFDIGMSFHDSAAREIEYEIARAAEEARERRLQGLDPNISALRHRLLRRYERAASESGDGLHFKCRRCGAKAYADEGTDDLFGLCASCWVVVDGWRERTEHLNGG